MGGGCRVTLTGASLSRLGWVVFGAAVATAFVRAATATPRPSLPPLTEADRRTAYALVVAEERNMRREATKDFPADPWSADDAFHNNDYRRAKQIAQQKRMSLQDVLRAMDDGMRLRWPKPAGIHQNPSVPPCRPRPIH